MSRTSPESMLLHALRFAADKHRDQRRKGEEASPYINHPIAVADVLSSHGIRDAVVLQAALLHDTIEDTETTAGELEREFGPEVRAVVVEVTDDKSLPKPQRKELQVERAPELSYRAKLVRLADKICNVVDVNHKPPADWPVEWRLNYIDWTERVVAGCRGTHAALEAEYDRAVTEARSRLD